MQFCTSHQTDKHTSTPPLRFFTGRILFLPPNQQRQSTEGIHESKKLLYSLTNSAQLVLVCCVTDRHALTLLVGWQEGHPACKKTECWGADVVVCLVQGADLHTAQLMPLPLTVSCFSKIQIGSTFLVLAHPGSHGQRAVKWVCVCVTMELPDC